MALDRDHLISYLFNQISEASSEIEKAQDYIGTLQNQTIFEQAAHQTFVDRCKSLVVSTTSLLLENIEGFRQAKNYFPNQNIRLLSGNLKDKAVSFYKEAITSSTISNYICNELVSLSTSLCNFSASNDYPDLLRSDFNYHNLPDKGPSGMAMIKGGRPINVPDGLEIKTSKNASITLDCHGPKLGTFLYSFWRWKDNQVILEDIFIAFLKQSDFKRGRAKSKHTTIKWNIEDPTKFISLVTGYPYQTNNTAIPSTAENISLFDYKPVAPENLNRIGFEL